MSPNTHPAHIAHGAFLYNEAAFGDPRRISHCGYRLL